MRISNSVVSRLKNQLLLLGVIVLTQACTEQAQISAPVPLISQPNQIFYALTDNNIIYELNVQNPGSPVRTLTISAGLEPEEKLLSIDFRPATGQLYAVGNKNHIYTINLRADINPGRATVVSPVPFNPGISGPEVQGLISIRP